VTPKTKRSSVMTTRAGDSMCPAASMSDEVRRPRPTVRPMRATRKAPRSPPWWQEDAEEEEGGDEDVTWARVLDDEECDHDPLRALGAFVEPRH